VVNEVCALLAAWEAASFSFEPFYDAYSKALAIMGEEVTVRAIDGSILAQGVVQGVDDSGQLLVYNQTITAVRAGDVTLREAPDSSG
jgi:biotin-(acetyl-CoA carboxylase) ligase